MFTFIASALTLSPIDGMGVFFRRLWCLWCLTHTVVITGMVWVCLPVASGASGALPTPSDVKTTDSLTDNLSVLFEPLRYHLPGKEKGRNPIRAW